MNENMNGIMIQELLQKIADEIAKNILCNQSYGVLESMQGDTPLHLDNCTGHAQSAPEGGYPMAHERIRVPVDINESGQYVTRFVSGNNDVERALNCVQLMYNSGFLQKSFPGWFDMRYSISEQYKEKLHPYEAVAEEWFEFNKSRTEEGTQTGNRSYLKHSLNYFGDTPIENIQVRHIQEFLNTRIDDNEEFLAKGTIRNIWSITKQVFEYAAAQGYISTNPARSSILRNPSDKASKRIALNNTELLTIRAAIPSLKEENERLYLLMLTNLPYRRGEAFGQRWEDIDFDIRTASVTGTVTVVNGKAKYRKKAKNDSSLRTMIAHESFLKELSPYKKSSGFILNEHGEHYTAKGIDDIWDSIKIQIPLIAEKGLTPHNFRHTVASVMYHESNDIISVAAQCGHTDGGRTTQKTYIHDDIEKRRNAVNKMESGLKKPA